MARDARQNKTVIISTKVNADAADKFSKAAQRLGLNSGYELVQLVTDCLLRYIDAPTEASSDLKRMMQVFDDFSYTRGRHMNIGNIDKEYIGRAIYFVTVPGKTTPSLINVEQPYFDQPRYSYNIQKMFTEFMRCAFPKQLKQLEDIARAIDADSTIDAFTYTLDNADKKSEDDVTFHEIFSDNARDITGQQLSIYDKKYKTHQHADINGARFNLHQDDKQQQMAQTPSLPFAD